MLQRDLVEETSFSFSREVPKPMERRQQERHLTILRVGALLVDGARELCLIRNISAGGLMAHVYCTLRPDQRVAVELKTNQQISGIVRWVQDSNCGIAFDEPIDVAELLANPPVLPNGWRPRMPRVEIDRMATVRVGARPCFVHVRDISQGGIKVETDQPLEPGRDVMVTLDGFRPVPGMVRWQSEAHCGISFNQPIPFGELMDWLKKSA